MLVGGQHALRFQLDTPRLAAWNAEAARRWQWLRPCAWGEQRVHHGQLKASSADRAWIRRRSTLCWRRSRADGWFQVNRFLILLDMRLGPTQKGTRKVSRRSGQRGVVRKQLCASEKPGL